MQRISVLTFHCGNAGDFRALPEILEYLHRGGVKLVPLLAVADHLVTGRLDALPDKTVALTFDDGMDMDFVDLEHPVHGAQPSFHTIMRDFDRRHGGATGVHGTTFVIASPLARAVIQERDMLGLPWMSDRWWQPAVASGASVVSALVARWRTVMLGLLHADTAASRAPLRFTAAAASMSATRVSIRSSLHA